MIFSVLSFHYDSDCLREGKVDLLRPASDLVTLTLHCSSENTPTLKLSQLTPSECKKELGALILHLAKRTAQLTSELRGTLKLRQQADDFKIYIFALLLSTVRL